MINLWDSKLWYNCSKPGMGTIMDPAQHREILVPVPPARTLKDVTVLGGGPVIWESYTMIILLL